MLAPLSIVNRRPIGLTSTLLSAVLSAFSIHAPYQGVPVITARIVGNKLVIEIPLNVVPVSSTSGKTLVVASTHGNKVTDAQVNGKNVVIGLNAYIPKG